MAQPPEKAAFPKLTTERFSIGYAQAWRNKKANSGCQWLFFMLINELVCSCEMIDTILFKTH